MAPALARRAHSKGLRITSRSGRIARMPRTFVWIAAEASVARALRDDLIARGHPKEWLKAAGYWIAGQADGSAKDL
ncbi:MAG: hypothetical protein CMO21_04750 [Thioclava sp.]|mgnify:CR=1 FL=1|nr:hypothetical protein [Thioclava sp.]